MLFLNKFRLLSEKAVQINRRSGWRAYLIAIAIQGFLFSISFYLQGESEALFALIYILSAICIAVFVGPGAGVVAGALASLSVGYHYIQPLGSFLNSWQSVVFLIISNGVIQFTLAGLRLLQLSLEQSKKDQKLAQEAALAREEILGIVAHDLRQPLSSIGMRADLLETTIADEIPTAAVKYIEGIQNDVDRLNRMIGDLLDISKIDSQQLSVHCEPVNLNELVQKVTDDFKNNSGKCPLKISSQSILTIWADPYRFQQVLGNLISNAIKYGYPDREIQIDLTEKNNVAEIIVVNQGASIPKHQLTVIFDRFVRTPEAKSSRVSGIGLGLYITRGIIEAHGGLIWAESDPGGSTSFHFTLPLAVDSFSGLENKSTNLISQHT